MATSDKGCFLPSRPTRVRPSSVLAEVHPIDRFASAGLDVTRPILVVLDGSKALRGRVLDVFDHPVRASTAR